MAKRLTDTKKWGDDWYLSLSNDYRIIWQWLLDNCDHAGFCKRSMTLLNLMCRTSVSEEDMLREMSGRVCTLNDNWFIPKFLKFQYTTLYSQKPAILSVVKLLFEKNATKLIPESFGNDYIIISESFHNHCKIIKESLQNNSKIIGQSFDNHCEMIKDKDIVISNTGKNINRLNFVNDKKGESNETSKSFFANSKVFYQEILRQKPTMNDHLRLEMAKQMETRYSGSRISDISALVEKWIENKK